MKLKIVIASQNEDKIREITKILKVPGVTFLTFEDFRNFPKVFENGKSLKDNAYIKASTLKDWFHLPALADDSGLEVDALGGAPGIYSSRYAGLGCSYEDNNKRLLKELADVPPKLRTACFRCCAVYVDPEGNYLSSEGICEGHIAMEPRGRYGFGYDPIFIPKGYDKAMAEISMREKNAISHRGKAFRKMKELLEKLLMNQRTSTNDQK